MGFAYCDTVEVMTIRMGRHVCPHMKMAESVGTLPSDLSGFHQANFPDPVPPSSSRRYFL